MTSQNDVRSAATLSPGGWMINRHNNLRQHVDRFLGDIQNMKDNWLIQNIPLMNERNPNANGLFLKGARDLNFIIASHMANLQDFKNRGIEEVLARYPETDQVTTDVVAQIPEGNPDQQTTNGSGVRGPRIRYRCTVCVKLFLTEESFRAHKCLHPKPSTSGTNDTRNAGGDTAQDQSEQPGTSQALRAMNKAPKMKKLRVSLPNIDNQIPAGINTNGAGLPRTSTTSTQTRRRVMVSGSSRTMRDPSPTIRRRMLLQQKFLRPGLHKQLVELDQASLARKRHRAGRSQF